MFYTTADLPFSHIHKKHFLRPILCYPTKTSPLDFRKAEITQCIFSHNKTKGEINSRMETQSAEIMKKPKIRLSNYP